MSRGNLQEMLSQRILVWIILVGRLGVERGLRETSRCLATLCGHQVSHPCGGEGEADAACRSPDGHALLQASGLSPQRETLLTTCTYHALSYSTCDSLNTRESVR